MKLLVLGATGRIGRQVVRAAARQGHEVVAFCHQPDPMAGPGLTSARPDVPAAPHSTRAFGRSVNAVTGDVYDLATLRAPVADVDAVVFAVGSRGQGPTRVRSAGVAAVIKVMRSSGVSRLVAASPSAAFISPRSPLGRKVARRYFVHKLYRNPFIDAERMEDEIRLSDLNWSVVRASPLRDWPASGDYRVVPDGQLGREWPVSVADLGDYIVACAVDEKAGQDIVTVTGNGRRRRPLPVRLEAAPEESAREAREAREERAAR